MASQHSSPAICPNMNQNETVRTDVQVLLADLKACSKTLDLERGKEVHAEALKCGHDSGIFVASALISMYAKCGSMVDARGVFDKMKRPDVVSWNALILGYADSGQGLTALEMFMKMKSRGVAPSSATFVAALKSCISLTQKRGATAWMQCKEQAKALHSLAAETGYISNIFVQNAFIDIYAKCSSMMDARKIFEGMNHQDVISWNALILGYAENGQGFLAFELFTRMKHDGPSPDAVTFMAALKACVSLPTEIALAKVREIHNLVKESGCDNVRLQNTLIDIYAKRESMVDARNIFNKMKHPDVISWNVLIMGYAENGQSSTALRLFSIMRHEGPAPDSVTFLAVFKSCGALAVRERAASGWLESMERCKSMHHMAIENACISDIYVQSSVIDMYSRCDSMGDAHRVFDSMKRRDVVAWNTLIAGYMENGGGLTSLELFVRMKREGPAPDSVTFASVLKACSMLGALEIGRVVHLEIRSFDVVLVSCLIDFYAKCGSLVEARGVFDLHPESRDEITWNTLLAGFSNCGDYKSMFEIFQEMQDARFKPNSVTFVSLLACCSHVGLVEKGVEYFELMSSRYELAPAAEHYSCMVDIFGRANKLANAMVLLQNMPCGPGVVTWKTVLSACRKWKNLEIGRLAFHTLISMNADDVGVYAVMGQLYHSRGMFQEQVVVMRMRKKRLKAGLPSR